MNVIAKEMNEVLSKNAPVLFSMLSDFGKRIFMPKGIIVQSAEAKQQAKKYNATIGIARENDEPMFLPSLKKYFNELKSADIFDYAPGFGNPDLRTKWKKKIIAENPSLKSIDDISSPVVTCGLTHGITLVADMFVDENDEIIIPDKLWENYNLILEERYKAKVVNYSLFNDSLTGFDTKALDRVLNVSKKEKIILLFNFPNNPTGYTPTKTEVNEIFNIVTKYADLGKKILVVCDDAYYGLLYEKDLLEGSIFSRFANSHKNIVAIKIDGVSKEDYSWGLRIGFITFSVSNPNADIYKVLESKVAAAIRCSISNCSQVAQSIFAKVLGDPSYNEEKKQKYEILKKRAQKTKEVVYSPKYKEFWDVYPFNSGYFMCLKLKGANAEELRQYALKQYQVGTIVLGDDLRVAFSSVELEQIEDLFNILANCVKELRK
ncbi:MAG TPA: aminotransferase class I/II-fold pyridoxal phosphate-dependent enzyme [Spirochaetota bacterium]|nr:aminotransferase class I/II-fold pyridoxal phosphate-dependent enzyme [Spirochaetota bacterium]